MAFTIKPGGQFLVSDGSPSRVFIRSSDINIFPCSRRGQVSNTDDGIKYYDPEARLNTERTNRIHTATNGFKASFISNECLTTSGTFTDNSTLKFVLAGYTIEVQNFAPDEIAAALGISTGTIYAYLGIQPNVRVNSAYSTEILYRQLPSDLISSNYLDVPYDKTSDFFMGVSFTSSADVNDASVVPFTLPLFAGANEDWALVQTSLLPKIDHDNTANSVVVDTLRVSEALNVDKDLHVIGDLQVDKKISVPYTGIIDDFPNTEITSNGISTASIEAGSIVSAGLTIEDDITIRKSDVDVTTVGENISTAGTVTASGLTITAGAGSGKIEAKEIVADKITQDGKSIPYIKLEQVSAKWQLQITTDASKK